MRPDDFVRYGRRALVGLRVDDVKAVSIERLCLSLVMSCFRIPMYVYEHFMNIMSISRIRISGYVTF